MKTFKISFILTVIILVSALYFKSDIFRNESGFHETGTTIPDNENEITGEKETGKFPNDNEYLKRTFPFGKADPDAHLIALKQAQGMREVTDNSQSEPQWEFAGPTNVGGRFSDLEYDPNNPNIIYAGAATGGIFKSTNAGLNFFPIFDDQAVLPIGDIAVDPINSNIIYVGTGEANGGHNNFAGGGIYKSTNGGANWQMIGLQNTVSIGRIVINPLNPLKVYVAAVGSYFGPNPERGIYRSIDGGASWSKILFISDSTGAIDIAMDQINPDNLLASMWEKTRYPNGGQLYGKTSGIYKSTNGGDNWISLGVSNGLPNSNSTNVGRIGLSISISNPNIAYSIFTNGSTYLGFFKTTNGGLNWTNADPGGQLENGFSTFSWYFGQVRVHPVNPDIVYVLDFAIMKTTNSGTSWSDITADHVDNHALAFKPGNPETIIEGNDGGIFNSTNGGSTFTKVADLPVTQFYEIGIDRTNPERLYGGTQDNGTNRTTTGSLSDWEHIYGGDGFYVIVDPTNPNVIYAESQNGGFGKSTDGGNSFNDATSGINATEKKNWSTPVVMDPNNNNILYFGTNKVYRTTNAAGNWTAASPDLTNGTQQRLGTVTTIDVAKSNSNVIIAGTDDANVWITSNNGANWTKVSSTLPYRWVTRVAFDPVNENIAYVTYNGLKWIDPQPHIFRTTDKGATWTDISNNLPDAPINALAIDPLRPRVLFVGSDVGCYYSTNTGQTWSFLGSGLPMVSVYDMKIHPTAYYIVIGTHGRSMYKLDMNSIVVGINSNGTKVADSYSLKQNFPNPFNPVTKIKYELGYSNFISLKVYDILGNEVKTLVSNNQQAGSYEVNFDGSGLSSGIYFYTLKAGSGSSENYSTTKKMLLIK
jgi:photosystem II stability/assembly factor-like uncharacterized protein